MIRPILWIIVLFGLNCVPAVYAQELNCQVEINTSEIESSSAQIFKTLESTIAEYMNTTAFTRHHFSPNEKINCRMFFNIKEYSDNNIKAELQIQSSRPVYNSIYTTTLFNFKDNNVQFTYQEYEPLTFSLTTMESQLTAILNFYAYLILALDYDSFAPKGGQEFYDRAQTVVLQAQSSGESGWRMFEDSRNRSAILSAFTDPATSVMRDILYDYHRKGLDEMSMSPEKARSVITRIVTEDLPKIYSNAPMSVALTIFRDAKLDEVINIFTQGTDTEKKDVTRELNELYPTDNRRISEINKEGK